MCERVFQGSVTDRQVDRYNSGVYTTNLATRPAVHKASRDIQLVEHT
jgi:hypothetical protein